MNTTVRKIGNSEGVILPKDVLGRLRVKAGDTLTIIEGSDGVQLTRADSDLARQLHAAREGMDKYKVALRELAK
jgi:putative addiction module antidote